MRAATTPNAIGPTSLRLMPSAARWRAAADLADGGRAKRLAAQKGHDSADAVADQLTSGIIAAWDVDCCATALHRGAKGALLGVGAGKAKHLEMGGRVANLCLMTVTRS